MKANGTVKACIRRYLAHLESRGSGSWKSYRSTLLPFLARWPRLAVDAVRVHHLTAWLDGAKAWKPGTRCSAWGRFMMCLAWNKAEGHVSANPVAGAKRPARYQRSARGAECVLPPPLASLLISSSAGPWRDYLLALARTGARPAELAHATAANYWRPWRAVVHRADEAEGFRHKTASLRKHGQRDRVIHLEGETERTVEKNAAKGGYLFPCRDRLHWGPGRIRASWLALLADERVSKWMAANNHSASRVVPYSFRHTWITSALVKGTPLIVVATLAGTSAAMIEKHYGHVGADKDAMRKAYLASI